MKPDALHTDHGREINALIFAPAEEAFERLLATLGMAAPSAHFARAADAHQLQDLLASRPWDMVITTWTGEEPWQQVTVAARDGGDVPVITALDDFNAVTYTQVLNAGGRYVGALHSQECMRAAMALARGTAAAATAPVHEPAGGRAGVGGLDLLTGLYNHQYLEDMFGGIAAQAPAAGHHHALLYIRMDAYLHLRTRLGAAVSGMLLADFAAVLRGCVDAGDIPVRLQDEVFAVLLRDRPREHVEQIAQTLLVRLRDHRFEVEGQTLHLTASIGAGLVSAAGAYLDDLMTKASLACEVAQDGGGGHYHVYDQAADEKLRCARQTDLEQQLRRALDADAFRTVFQPIAQLHAPGGENYEVLLRMVNAQDREILPAVFLGTALNAGLMPQIDRWVIRHALTRLRQRQNEHRPTRFFIKLDAQSVADAALLPWLAQQLRDHRVAGDRLVIEFSEPAIAKDLAAFQRLAAGLRELHCLCAMEHAGRTPRAAEIIAALPVDFIKVDGSLTHALADSEPRQASVKALIDAAKATGKRSIVPFVEDAKSLSLLWRWGADYVQGHYLQRPDARLQYAFEGG